MLLHRTNAIGAMCVILGGLATATLGQPMEAVAPLFSNGPTQLFVVLRSRAAP